ncbi:MAG TPA: carboxypeptidase-like regulatory domain-containing protein [Chitinophagaceae bacterium]|nr:carboxypeptidase-like regulatory domain-containing protein [Chitinophagaceae bacterium]
MKKNFIVSMFSLFVFWGISNAQTKINGVVKDGKNNPLIGAAVINKTKNIKTVTKANGEFEIEAIVNDIISVSYIGYTTNEFVITDDKAKLEIQLSVTQGDLNEVVVVGVSPKSYWLGARLAYNIDGAQVDNIVGSATIGINPVEGEYLGANWGIVGNFANFISVQNKEKTEKDLLKVAQSSQGLSIGFGGTWEVLSRSNDFNFRCYFISGYRLNAFQKVGKDSISVSLSQFRNTAGIEFEGFRFKNGGKLHFSFEGSLTAFSRKKYELVFGEKKSSLNGLEITAILPIAANIGFLANGTYAKNLNPVYQFGIIFKDLK